MVWLRAGVIVLVVCGLVSRSGEPSLVVMSPENFSRLHLHAVFSGMHEAGACESQAHCSSQLVEFQVDLVLGFTGGNRPWFFVTMFGTCIVVIIKSDCISLVGLT